MSKTTRHLFVAAQGGTLLLDEIGEMSAEMQAKLLRVLEECRLRPVGANREIDLDVRILAATNRNLEAEVREGGFREDLFFRLETFQVEVPPLRARGDDLELLAAQLVARFGAHRTPVVNTISSEAVAVLRAHTFPGNVRELSNALERAAQVLGIGRRTLYRRLGLDD